MEGREKGQVRDMSDGDHNGPPHAVYHDDMRRARMPFDRKDNEEKAHMKLRQGLTGM